MQATMMALLRSWLMDPPSQLQFLIALGASVLVFALVQSRVGSAFDLKVAGPGRALLVLVITVGSALALQAVAQRQAHPSGWVLIGIAAAAVLAIGAPAACLIQKGGYLPALFSLGISLAAAALVVVFIHVGGNIFKGGEHSVGRGLKHNRETEAFIGK